MGLLRGSQDSSKSFLHSWWKDCMLHEYLTGEVVSQAQAELEGGEDRQLGIFLMASDQRKIQRKIIKICDQLG